MSLRRGDGQHRLVTPRKAGAQGCVKGPRPSSRPVPLLPAALRKNYLQTQRNREEPRPAGAGSGHQLPVIRRVLDPSAAWGRWFMFLCTDLTAWILNVLATHRSNHERVMDSIVGVPSRQRAGRSERHFARAKSIAVLFVNYLVIKLDKIIIKIKIAGGPKAVRSPRLLTRSLGLRTHSCAPCPGAGAPQATPTLHPSAPSLLRGGGERVGDWD